ncbi:MAG: PASTA domain-containing protein [Coriobacteriia bacterium]|nr:PASTA domain-containing protein [Coriobacteriia bacterium]
MAAEFDTQPDYAGEDEPVTEPQGDKPRNSRGGWLVLALLALGAILLLLWLLAVTAKVPNLTGLSRSDAEAKLEKSGFTTGDVSEIAADGTKPGTVREQAPAAGLTVRKGSSIDLLVAAGGNLISVPNVIGQDSASASVKVLQAGFKVSSSEEYSDDVPEGVAVSQSPPAGSLAMPDSTVTVYYSLGSQSMAAVAVDRSDTDSGLNLASTGTGTGNDPKIMNCTDAYPDANAWSSGGDIYVRLTPGGSARQVTSTGDWDTDPVVAPSGKYVVFLRAPGSGDKATGVGAVCLTDFDTHMLSMLPVNLSRDIAWSLGKPVFAPSSDSATPDSDWIVFPQYWSETFSADEPTPQARLIICNVPTDSKWVSWNIEFRPAYTVNLSAANRTGCVRVRHTNGGTTLYDRDFNVWTGLYLR